MRIAASLPFVVLFVAVLSGAQPGQRGPASSLPSPGPSASTPALKADRFKAGDAAYRARKSDARAREALKLYRAVYDEDVGDVEAGWRVGMVCYFVGLRVAKDPEEKKALFAEGRDAAAFAAKREPNCAACHFWAAINTTLHGQEVGRLKTYFGLEEVREMLKTSIRLDPGYMYAGAYRLLGVIDQRLPSMLGGSVERAREYYEKAVAQAPDEPLNYLFLAKLLAETPASKARAREVAARGAAIGDLADERLESIEARDELKQLLKSL